MVQFEMLPTTYRIIHSYERGWFNHTVTILGWILLFVLLYKIGQYIFKGYFKNSDIFIGSFAGTISSDNENLDLASKLKLLFQSFMNNNKEQSKKESDGINYSLNSTISNNLATDTAATTTTTTTTADEEKMKAI